jgi:trimeric autotransporter adhesin
MKRMLYTSKPFSGASRKRQVSFFLILALLSTSIVSTPVYADTGSAVLMDIMAGTASSLPSNLTDVDGTLFFTADDSIHGTELWKSDGTPAGTTLVKDLSPGQSGSFPSQLTNVAGKLYFVVDDGIHGYELWRSDGTPDGTVMFKDLYPGSASSFPSTFMVLDNILYFGTNHLEDHGGHGGELWRSDGTPDGTVPIKPIRPTNSFGVIDGMLVFNAWDDINTGLWKSDGTAAGTIRIAGWAADLVDLNGTLLFSDYTNLWSSDGTASGTTLIKTFPIPPPPSPEDPPPPSLNRLTSVNQTLVFSAFDGQSFKLWRSDGTPEGTTILVHTVVEDLERTNTSVLFTINDPNDHNDELWKTDGTLSGTVLVKDFSDIASSAYAYLLTNVNGTLFFNFTTGKQDRELWKSDGTSAGTVRVKVLTHTIPSYEPSHEPLALYQVRPDGRLLLWTLDGDAGISLWASNGTEQGTVPIQQIDVAYPLLMWLTISGSKIFFALNGRSSGFELWALDIDAFSIPVANDTTLIAKTDTVITGTLDAVDLDSDALTYTIVDNGAKGLALITNSATGAFTYTPNSNASGADQFTFQVNDGAYTSRLATVRLQMARSLGYLPFVHNEP